MIVEGILKFSYIDSWTLEKPKIDGKLISGVERVSFTVSASKDRYVVNSMKKYMNGRKVEAKLNPDTRSLLSIRMFHGR